MRSGSTPPFSSPPLAVSSSMISTGHCYAVMWRTSSDVAGDLRIAGLWKWSRPVGEFLELHLLDTNLIWMIHFLRIMTLTVPGQPWCAAYELPRLYNSFLRCLLVLSVRLDFPDLALVTLGGAQSWLHR